MTEHFGSMTCYGFILISSGPGKKIELPEGAANICAFYQENIPFAIYPVQDDPEGDATGLWYVIEEQLAV